MRVWHYKTREIESPFKEFEDGTVQADTFDEALQKVRDHYKKAYGGIKLEVVEVSLETEVDIE